MTHTQRRPQSFVALAMLATGTLYWALDLSAGDRGTVDWVVISLLILAIGWHVFQLTRRLAGLGSGATWQVPRTALFWIIGLMNTLFRDPNDLRSWNFALGVLLVGAAVVDTVVLARKERQVLAHATAAQSEQR